MSELFDVKFLTYIYHNMKFCINFGVTNLHKLFINWHLPNDSS